MDVSQYDDDGDGYLPNDFQLPKPKDLHVHVQEQQIYELFLLIDVIQVIMHLQVILPFITK